MADAGAEVYQMAVDFADEIASLTESFPRSYGFLVDQSNRAALSITTNLASELARGSRESFPCRAFRLARTLSSQRCLLPEPTLLGKPRCVRFR
jgi:23S rRNA-intervening sequence protein